MWIRNGIMLAAAAYLWSSTAPSTRAQDAFPVRPVKIVMPLPPGAAPDVRIRIIAEHLSGVLGQRVIVENQPGAGGVLGTQAVLTSPVDGYTLLAAPNSVFTILPAQKDKLPFDVNRDLIPIVMTTDASTSSQTAHGRWSARMPGISPGRSRGSCGRERARLGAFGTPPRSSFGARFWIRVPQ